MRFSTPLMVLGLACLLLTGCHAKKDTGMNEFPEISAKIKDQLAFTCAQEKDRIPPHVPEAEQLYKHARWLVKGNLLKQDVAKYPAIERLVRIAAAYGHDKANIELRDMLEASQAVSPDPVNEVIDLTQDLIKRGIPSGYYAMGWYLEHGYGVRADSELAFKYYRKSADLGSPEGQFLVGQKLADERTNGTEVAAIGLSMWRCAASQGHSDAAKKVGIWLQHEDNSAAIHHLQIAASAGGSTAAFALANAFSTKGASDEAYAFGQTPDPEREARYRKISSFLSDYSYLHPTVTEIDQIVPPPPTKLPAWDGKFKWLEEHKANKAPPLPTEERIAEMAKAKGLDAKSGRPLTALK